MEEYESIEEDMGFDDLRIVVVGCGGAGCNSIDRLSHIGIHGAETVAVNTDKVHLGRINADKKLLIGKSITRGYGAGGLPEVGERCAELAHHELTDVLKGADMTFVIAGMGGGTGTGAAPFVSDLARSEGSVVIGIATTPFKAERGKRKKNAKYGLGKFRTSADSVIALENERLLKIVPNLPFEQALGVMDQLISEVIKGVTEAITKPSLINLDFADVRTVIRAGGHSTVLYGENSAEEPSTVVSETLNSPLFDVEYANTKTALIHMTSGPTLPIKTVHEVVYGITEHFDDNAHVILGVSNDNKDYNGIVKVVSIVTEAETRDLPVPGLKNLE
jgi:cell division protein FtsZ